MLHGGAHLGLVTYRDLPADNPAYLPDLDPPIREQVAMALLYKGVTLGRLDRPADELAAYEQLIGTFAADDHPPIREQVAMALLYQAVTLAELDRPDPTLRSDSSDQ